MTGRRRLPAVLAAAVALGLTSATLASVAPAAGAVAPDYVKYYEVTSSADTLASVALRLLGSADRAGDLYDANAGRKQPDGGTLTRTGPLRAGWVLVLPFDAVGAGVKYGLLPTPAPAPPPAQPSPTAQRTSSSAPVPRATTPSTTPSASRTPTRKPADKPKPKVVPATTSTCQAAVKQQTRPENWASLRLAADQAWVRSRGRGQTIAIVDSGADGSLPQLAARTAEGADVVGGTGRGNADCLGTGTAMASIIAGQPVSGSSLAGLAPDATVLPIRVVTTQPTARGVDVATAVRMAVTAGSSVIVLGTYADTTDRAVAGALHDALERGVVVVAPALASGPVDPEVAGLTEGVLRVGGIGVDGQMMTGYREGGVHLVAPGKDIAALGITGVGMVPVSGAQYAAAFVGATAALVRAAYPELTAAQVVRRLEATADRMPDRIPDGRYGWGLVSPRSAVETVLAEESPPPDPAQVAAAAQRDRQLPALIIIIGLALIVTTLLAVRVRRLVLQRDEPQPPPEDEPRAGARHRLPPEPPPADEGPPPVRPAEGSEWSREAAGSGLAYRSSRDGSAPD